MKTRVVENLFLLSLYRREFVKFPANPTKHQPVYYPLYTNFIAFPNLVIALRDVILNERHHAVSSPKKRKEKNFEG